MQHRKYSTLRSGGTNSDVDSSIIWLRDFIRPTLWRHKTMKTPSKLTAPIQAKTIN